MAYINGNEVLDAIVVKYLDAPTETLNITENGEYDVLNYLKAIVNVAGGGVEITDVTLNADGTYTVTDKDNNTHTLAVTETDGQITAITYDGDNVPLNFDNDGYLIGVGEADIDVSGYKGVGRLPAEYQEVEYIETTGTQYIDTGLDITDFTATSFIWELTSITPEYQLNGLLNDQASNPTSKRWCEGVASNNGTKKYSWMPVTAGADWVVQTNTPLDTQKTKISCSLPLSRIFQDGLGYSFANIGTAIASGLSFYIGRLNDRTSISWSNPCYAKYYSYIFYKNIDDKVADFVPCYRKSDNVIGMYDIVRNQFFTNQGTGVFLKGGDV